LIELDTFALPCGCAGITANMRGLKLMTLRSLNHSSAIGQRNGRKPWVKPTVTFARLVPEAPLLPRLIGERYA